MAHDNPLKHKVLHGVGWTLTGRGLVLLAHLISTVILARLLAPEDFGVYGIALIFSGLATRFGNAGFGLALIQKKDITDTHVSSLFITNVVVFWSLAGGLILTGKYIGNWFESESVGSVVQILGLNFVLTPFSSVAKALLQRDMNFKTVSFSGVADHAVSVVTAIVLAFQGFGVWSLVYSNLSGSIAGLLVVMIGARWVPRLRYSHAAMKELYSFGFHMFLKNLIIYASDKIDYLVIGKQIGPAGVGFYEKAFNLMELSVKEFGAKIGPVFFSAFSQMQDEAVRLRRGFEKVMFSMSVLVFPVFMGLCVTAEPFIQVVFGEKWLPSVLPLQILCVAGIVRLELQVISSILNATGQVASEVARRGIGLIFLATGCYVGSFWGINGVAIAVVVTGIGMALSIIARLLSHLAMSWRDFLSPQIPAFNAGVFMVTCVFAIKWLIESGDPPVPDFAVLLACVGTGVLSYVGFFVLFSRSTLQNFRREVLDSLKPLPIGHLSKSAKVS